MSVHPVQSMPLTPRESEVYKGLLNFIRYQDVASALGLSVNTVKTHAKRVFRKKGVNSHVELIQHAIREQGIQL